MVDYQRYLKIWARNVSFTVISRIRGFFWERYPSWRLSHEAGHGGSSSYLWCFSGPKVSPCGQLRLWPITNHNGGWTPHGSLWLCATCHWKSMTSKQANSLQWLKDNALKHMRITKWSTSLGDGHIPFGHPNRAVRAVPRCRPSRASVGLQTRLHSSTSNWNKTQERNEFAGYKQMKN